MDWANEKYVRVFTRDTPEWLVLPWQAKALWPLMVRKFDRSGILATKLGARGVAVLVGLPIEVVTPGLTALLEDGCLELHDLGYLAPNYLEAQETPQSDANRQRESRERRRVRKPLIAGPDDVAQTTECHVRSRGVTSGHAVSQPVTPDQSGPDQKDLPPAHAIQPSTEYDSDSALKSRQDRRAELWAELERARAEVAAELGIVARPLPVQDPGERELSSLLSGGADLERITVDVRHAIAMAVAEARRDRSVQWLSGGMFGERPFRRLVAMTEADAAKPRDGPKRGGPTKPPERPNPIKPWT